MISYAQPLDLEALSPLFVPFALLSVASPVLSLLPEFSNSHLQLYPLSFFIYLILKLWVQETLGARRDLSLRNTYQERASFWFS